MESHQSQLHDYFFAEKPIQPGFENPWIKWGVIFIFIGAGIFFLLQNTRGIPFLLIFTGIVMVVYAIIIYLEALQRYNNRINDETVDDYLLEDLKTTVQKKALEKFQLDEADFDEERILLIPGPIYWVAPGVSEGSIFRKKGHDGRYRYTVWQVVILLLNANYISIYECTYDWLSNYILDERTNEFFHHEIATVRTETIEKKRQLVNDEGVLNFVQIFKMTNLSSDTAIVETNDDELMTSPKMGRPAEHAVRTIRALLREKKAIHIGTTFELPVEKEDTEISEEEPEKIDEGEEHSDEHSHDEHSHDEN